MDIVQESRAIYHLGPQVIYDGCNRELFLGVNSPYCCFSIVRMIFNVVQGTKPTDWLRKE